MTDASQMATLLQKMTGEVSTNQIVFTESQMRAIVEIAIPKMITEMPGMESYNLSCRVEPNPNGWTIRVDKPRAIEA